VGACRGDGAPVYPDLARFLSGLLEFPEDRIRQEVRQGEGYSDLVLLDPEGDPWLLVEFKPDDAHLTDPERRRRLWEGRRKYLGGMARGMLFVTPRWLWARDPRGEAPDPGLPEELWIFPGSPRRTCGSGSPSGVGSRRPTNAAGRLI
jgi:hypothetical protein